MMAKATPMTVANGRSGDEAIDIAKRSQCCCLNVR